MSEPRDELVLSIDVGTQSIRAALVDAAGEIRRIVQTPIEPYRSPRPGWAEQDADGYWRMLGQTTRDLLVGPEPLPGRLVAAALTTQRMTFVPVDRDGEPVRPAIVWLDARRADVRRVLPAPLIALSKATGAWSLFDYAVGASRSNWLRQNEPETWARTAKLHFLSGFLTHRLTGEHVDSTGNMFGVVPFDVRRSDWAAKGDLRWRLFPIERDRLPDLVRPTERLGSVTARAAAETGIPAGLPLIAASNDKACDIIGAGCLTPDVACLSLGTTATVNVQTDRPVELRRFLAPYPSAVPGEYYTEVGVIRGLWMVSWFREEFGLAERQLAADSGLSPEEHLEQLARSVPPGSMGLVCQPTWSPAPGLPPETKGALVGFGDVHTRAHVYRAILEGLAYALKEGADLTARRTKVPIREVRATGGGSRSDTLLQVLADVFDLPVRRPHTHETAIVGAAIDGAVGAGLHPDVPAAVRAMTRSDPAAVPNPEHVALYRGLYERVYRPAHGRLRPLYREIAAVTGYPRL